MTGRAPRTAAAAILACGALLAAGATPATAEVEIQSSGGARFYGTYVNKGDRTVDGVLLATSEWAADPVTGWSFGARSCRTESSTGVAYCGALEIPRDGAFSFVGRTRWTATVFRFCVTTDGGFSQSCDLVVAAPPPPPQCPTIAIRTTALDDAIAGRHYRGRVSASGGAPPYRFSLESGSLPAGLEMSASGAIRGIPSRLRRRKASRSFRFTVDAVDSKGCQGSAVVELTVFGRAARRLRRLG